MTESGHRGVVMFQTAARGRGGLPGGAGGGGSGRGGRSASGSPSAPCPDVTGAGSGDGVPVEVGAVVDDTVGVAGAVDEPGPLAGT